MNFLLSGLNESVEFTELKKESITNQTLFFLAFHPSLPLCFINISIPGIHAALRFADLSSVQLFLFLMIFSSACVLEAYLHFIW